MNELKKPFWSIDLELILKYFNVDPSIGLSEEEVQKRKKEFGPNIYFPPPESVSSDDVLKDIKLMGFAFIFIDLIIFLVIFIPTAIFCGIVSILGDGGLTMTIVIFVSISIVKLYQIILLFKISNILKPWLDDKLKVEEPEIQKITVFREGKEHKIDPRELVPGDIIILDTRREQIAGDARLLESNDLEVYETHLTGSSEYSIKDASVAFLPESTAIYELVNMVFATTSIVKGDGRAVVVATGKNTEVSKISVPIPEFDWPFELGPTPADKYKKPSKILWLLHLTFFMIIMILSWISCSL